MGFYNIYKILKDMIRTLFGRKVLKAIILILLITIVLLIVDKKTVQAVTTIDGFTFEDLPQEINIDDYVPSWVTENNFNYFFSYSYYDGDPTKINWCFYVFTGDYIKLGENFSLYRDMQIVGENAKRYNSNYVYGSDPYDSAHSISAMLNRISSITRNNNITTLNCELATKLNATSCYVKSTVPLYNYDLSITIFSPEPPVHYPEIATSLSDLETLDFDVLSINGWDYSTEDLYLLCYDRNSGYMESLETLYPVNEILLNQDSKYFMYDLSADPSTNAIYWIPKDEIGFNWVPNGTYAFRFAIMDAPHEGRWL